MLKREADLLTKLPRDPSIITVQDVFEENNTIYMVKELVEGITLRQYLRLHGKWGEEEIRGIGLLLLNPLRTLHNNGVVHLDICPDNIIIGKSVKLLDYGTAIFFSESKKRATTVRLRYSPPEQYVRSGVIGPWTDFYALGAVLYELATKTSIPMASERLEYDRVLPPKEINSDISEDLNRIILKAVALSPEDRFQTPEEFQKNLIRDGTSTEKIKKFMVASSLVLWVELLFAFFRILIW